MPQDNEWTESVPSIGKRLYGLSRNASYDAARRGDIITVTVGRLKLAPKRANEERALGLQQARPA